MILGFRVEKCKVINGFPFQWKGLAKCNNENYEQTKSISIGTGTNLFLLLLLLDDTELLTDGRAILAFMIVEDLLHFQDTLTSVLILTPLLGLLGARTH